MCQFGVDYKKPTKLLTNHPSLFQLERRCCGGHVHIHLRGAMKNKRGKWVTRTSVAGEYPRQLCSAWAQAALALAPSAKSDVRKWDFENQQLLNEWQEIAERGSGETVPSRGGQQYPPDLRQAEEYL
eukprot:383125-Karenia_brevis.AAC.1